jgi:microsomal dipeptidase-like Zn-dependent dipeptidase
MELFNFWFVSAHINHVRSIAGVDSVGLGAGYDGINL